MTVEGKPWFTKRVLLFVLLGLFMLVLYFYYFVGVVNVVDVIEQTNLFYYTAAFIAFLVSVLFSSLSWHILLSSLGIKMRIRRVLLFMWFGMFFDATIPDPGWSGDLTKAYMLAKTSGEDAGRIAASVVGQKIILVFVTIIALICGLALLALNYTLSSAVLIFIGFVLFLSTFALIMICYLSAKPKATKRMLDWLIRAISLVRGSTWNSLNFRLRGEETLNRFHEGMQTLIADPKALARPVAFSVLGWNFDVLVIFLTFISLGYPVPVDKVLIVYALTGSLQIVGLFFIGFAEIIISSSYTVLGIPPAIGLSVTLLTRVVTLWFKLVVSYVAFQWAGVGILLDKKPKGTLPSKP